MFRRIIHLLLTVFHGIFEIIAFGVIVGLLLISLGMITVMERFGYKAKGSKKSQYALYRKEVREAGE